MQILFLANLIYILKLAASKAHKYIAVYYNHKYPLAHRHSDLGWIVILIN